MERTTILISAAVLLVGYGVYSLLQVGSRLPGMPPGPPTIPILGNLLQVPIKGVHKQFRLWANQYGGVYSLKFGPTNVIVLCDRKAIHELVDKKGVLYSDRPHTYIGNMMTQGDHMVVSSLDPLTKEKRKVVTHNFSPRMLEERAAHIQEAEITVLMKDFLDTPDKFYTHVRRVTASIANILIFGQRGATYDSFWGRCVYDALDRFGEALELGANPPVDEFPFLRWIPTRFAEWKRRAVSSGKAMDKIWSTALETIEKRRSIGDTRHCIADRLIDEYAEKGNPFNRHAFMMLLGEMCEGGAETTSSSMLTMILAITKYPEVQRKARIQLDAVCGTERSPQWSDFDQIPYVNSIVKEGMRWRPVISSGLPHRNKEDDYYEGMFIPKDSTIFIPIWALNNSEKQGFSDPETYNPDRYLNHPKLANDYAGSADWAKRDHYGYGTGRRMCPGIHLAERNQWRMVAKLLWAFEFSEATDPKTGKTLTLDTEAYNIGLLHAPKPFKCNIKPRSQAHIDVIRREAEVALKSLEQWE